MNDNKEFAEHLYLLSWHDALERIDILLSEIRNLQTNIIYVLKQPKLYGPLRYEEKHVWNITADESSNEKSRTDQEKKIKKNQSIDDDSELAYEWVILYPDPFAVIGELLNKEENLENNRNNKEVPSEKQQIDNQLKLDIADIWTSTAWGRTQRRYYHQLCSLQILKQQLVCDRITLSRQALKCSFSKTNQHVYTAESSAIFMLLRRGILYRLAGYIDRFRDHQQQFGKSLDSSFQDHPRPYVERRRDMALYMDFISDRCRDIRDHMMLFLKDTGSINEKKSKNKSRLILHGWTHSSQTKTQTLFDRVSNENKNDIDYVSTNFFTPDRPDLQPSIAHEVAHGIVRRQFNNLTSDLDAKDDFSYLLMGMRSIIYGAGHNLQNTYYQSQIDDRLIEIACDLLATCVKGTSYLYALFLEIIGGHSEWLLRTSKWNDKRGLDLSLIDDNLFIQNLNQQTAAHQVDWYYRLHLVSEFIFGSNHMPHGEPESILLNGVKQVSDDLLDLIMPINSSQDGIFWREVTNQLCEILRNSVWLMEVKKWRLKRSNDDSNEETEEKGPREMPRTMRRLDRKAREILFSEHLYAKTQSGKKLSKFTQNNSTKKNIIPKGGVDLYEQFFNEYLGRKIDDGRYLCPDFMHRHLYDIPYMCALTRAQDLRSLDKPYSIYSELHNDMVVGRRLYQIGLEFFIRDVESAHHRLIRIIPLVIEFLTFKNAKTPDQLKSKLKQWLCGENPKCLERYGEDNMEFIKDKLPLIYTEFVPKKRENIAKATEELINQYGAILISLLPFLEDQDAGVRRKLEKLAGHTLDNLYMLLDDSCHQTESEDFGSYLDSLRHYLALRHGEKSKDKLYDFIRLNLGFDAGVMNLRKIENKLKRIPIYLISRVSLLNQPMRYSLLENRKKVDESFSIKNLYLTDKMKFTFSDSHRSTISMLTGRYDALIITETSPPCLCPLPVFSKSLKAKSSNALKDDFPIFFGQRESAIALNLHVGEGNYDINDGKKDIQPEKFFAYISVSLSHRGYRLDLIYRLFLAQEKANKIKSKEYSDKKYKSIEEMACQIEFGDHAFLTDSWEDIIFAFAAMESDQHEERLKAIYDRLEFIFDFQNALYEDFMVDRTEMMFSPECIDAVYKYDSDEQAKYALYHRLRTSEDRHLVRSNESLVKTYNRNIKEQKQLYQTSLRKTPGRMDFTFEAKPKRIPDAENSFIKILLNLDKNEDQLFLIDRTETSLQKIEKDLEDN